MDGFEACMVVWIILHERYRHTCLGRGPVGCSLARHKVGAPLSPQPHTTACCERNAGCCCCCSVACMGTVTTLHLALPQRPNLITRPLHSCMPRCGPHHPNPTQHMARGHRGVATPAIRQAWRCVVLQHCGPHKWVANPRGPPAAQKGGPTPALCRRHRQPDGVWRDEQGHHAAGAAEQAAPAMQACTMIGRLSNA